jgi:hypothetical protein
LWLPRRRRRRRRRRAITTIREERIMADEQELTAVEEVVNAERKVEKAVENHQPEEDKGKEIAHVSKDDVKGSEMDIDDDKEKLEVAKEEQEQQENDKAREEQEKVEEDVVEEEKAKEEEAEAEEVEQVEEEEEEEEVVVEEKGKKEKETTTTRKKAAGRPKKGRAKSEELSTPRGRGEKRQRQKKEIFPFFTDRPTRERKSIERFIASVEKETNKDIEIKQVLQPAGFSFLFFSQRVLFFPAAAEHIYSSLSFPSFFLSSSSPSFLPARDRQTDNRTRLLKSS